MRDIKFRAWIKREGVMVRVAEMNMCEDDQESDDIEYVRYFNDEILNYPRNDIELMQYIGCKDKNGKEIYEGDIAKYKDMLCVVEYSEEYARFIMKSSRGFCIFYYSNSEVIGNIYENPELLKI